jgi:ABC-type transport system involved in cytochrome c biogenesis permease subunit
MSQEEIQPPVVLGDNDEVESERTGFLRSYMPVLVVFAGSFAVVLLRISFGGERFISDGALMMLALASYLTAAVFFLTNLYAPSKIAERLGTWGAAIGVLLNLSSWMVRWVAAYDRELEIFLNQGRSAADMPWFFRYIPFANLYDMSLAFAFGAGIATLFVIRRGHFRIVAALSLPLAAIILVLARFIGGEFIDLPPVLDSYWRPIHVGVASLSYGVALVCFAVAVLYLLKDGLKVQTMAIWTSIFALSVFATISKFSVFSLGSFGSYTASAFVGESRMHLALRADIPYVGWIIVVAAALLAGGIISYMAYLNNSDKRAEQFGRYSMRAALVMQAAGIGMLVYQIKQITDVSAHLNPAQYERFAVWMLQQQEIQQVQIVFEREPAVKPG